MLDRNGMINALAAKAEEGKVTGQDLQQYRKRLHEMGLTKLAELYRQETGNDPYTMKPPVPESAPPTGPGLTRSALSTRPRAPRRMPVVGTVFNL